MEETKEKADVVMNNDMDEEVNGTVIDVQTPETEEKKVKVGGVDPHPDPHLDPLSNGVKAGYKAYRDTKTAIEQQQNRRYSEDQMAPVLAELKARGVDIKALTEKGDLQRLQQGQMTSNLYQYTFTNANGNIITQQGKISFLKNEEGNLRIYTMPVKHLLGKNLEEHLQKEVFFGHQFTAEEIKALLLTGNAGQPIMLNKTANTDPNGLKPHLVSIDDKTHQLRAMPVDKVRKFARFLDAELSEEQQEQLRNGKPLRVTYTASVLDHETGELKPAKRTSYIQYNAVEMRLKTLPSTLFTPKQFMGHQLTEDERKSLSVGQVVKIEDAIDKKGQKFTAFLDIKDDGVLRMRDASGNQLWQKEKAKQQAKPTDDFKEQVALNNEGHKTEAVKASGKESLKAGEKPKPKQAAPKTAPAVSKPKPKAKAMKF